MESNNSNNNSYVIWIIVAAAVFIVLIATIIIVSNVKNKIKKKKAETAVDNTIKESTTKLADKFGGKNNINKIQQSLSRVTVLVNDPTIVDKEGIKEIFDSCMFMGNKIVFVIGSDSEKFKALLEENVDKIEK